MFALSSDRFHLFVLVDQDHNHTIGKSKVNLKIMTSSHGIIKRALATIKINKNFTKKYLTNYIV